jgi:hypothetical protein
MRNQILALPVAALFIVVAACSNDTSSMDSAYPRSGSASIIGGQKVVVTPWSGSLQGAKKSDLCAVDAVNGKKVVNGSFEVESGQPVAFEGWVSTSDLHNPGSISIIFHGTSSFAIESNTGIKREDVAHAYKTDDLMNSGYKIDLAALSIPAGSYVVSLVHEETGVKFVCYPKLGISVK